MVSQAEAALVTSSRSQSVPSRQAGVDDEAAGVCLSIFQTPLKRHGEAQP